MKLRWILPPLAALSVWGVVWVSRHGNAVSAASLLAGAKEHIGGKDRSPRLALRELDEALRLVDPRGEAELHREILHERSLLYRSQGLTELALADCRTALAAHGPEVETLVRANDLALQLGDSGLALEFARALDPLDPAAAKSRIGRCQVALADAPLAALELHARSVLSGPEADAALALAQRAAVFAGDPGTHTAALEELSDLFTNAEDRRRVAEWVREAAERLESARTSFVQSLEPGSSGDAVAGLQDLFLRGGAQVDAVELGLLALTRPGLAAAMPIVARTASALEGLGLADTARALIRDQSKSNAAALRPALLPSHDLRDELEEWCFLLERLELWEELRLATGELAIRGGLRQERERVELARFLNGLACLRLNDLRSANQSLGSLGGTPVDQHDIPTRAWLARAEIGRRQKQLAQERHALLLATRSAPLSPGPRLARELGQAWLRLAELRQGEGETLAAFECLTHALRLLPERLAELEPGWTELGKKSLAARGKNPFALLTRARAALERKQYGPALFDAQALLGEYPGLGPALEVVSKAAFRQHDYGLAIASSLELVERGWPTQEASARLRAMPEAFFLPADRVRWMRLDPRASVVPIQEHLRARGERAWAARVARTATPKFQPPEDLVRLARALFEDGQIALAAEMLTALPPEHAVFAQAAGLILRVAAAHALQHGEAELLTPTLAAVLASGRAEDPELLAALDLLLAAGRLAEAGRLADWIVASAPPFLGEALLRAATHELLVRGAEASGDPAERAEALLDDGRAGLARLFLASEGGDEAAVARAAGELLSGPLASEPGPRAALLVLAGEHEHAAEELSTLPGDGRALLAELARAVLAQCAPETLVRGDGGAEALETLPPMLTDTWPPLRWLTLGLAAHVAPWSPWTLGRTNQAELAEEPWVRLLRARAAATAGLHELARHELGGERTALGARGAWLAARLEESAGAERARVEALELEWLRAAGPRVEGQAAWIVPRARLAHAEGRIEDAVAELEAALAGAGEHGAERRLLAELERGRGRHARALELLLAEHAAQPKSARAALLPELLDTLHAARESGELGEARWWTEVEALEAEHPRDPAPVRALAQRAFEQAAASGPASAVRAGEMLARQRERTLGRSLESLRTGEGLRWVQLFARYSPARALALAHEELELAPLEPELWRALAEAELANGQWAEALATLEAIQSVAPEREAARLLMLTAFRLDSDARQFQKRLTQLARLDESALDDPLLAFYRLMADMRLGTKGALAPEKGMELWKELEDAGLAEARLGRAFAIALFETGKRALALQVLARASAGAESALERDLFAATEYLIQAGPEKPRVLTPQPASKAEGDASKPPAKKPGKGAGKQKPDAPPTEAPPVEVPPAEAAAATEAPTGG